VKKAILAIVALLVLLVGGGYFYWRSRIPPLPRAPSPEQIAALREERDRLRERFRQIVRSSELSEQGLSAAPPGDVIIGVPTSFARKVTERMVTGLFGHTTLVLHNLKVHKEDELKAKMIFSKRTMGTFVLDVEIEKIRGILRPGPPAVAFQRGRLEVTLSVAVPEGDGQAQIRFQWDGKGVAGAVCGDMDISTAASGSVIPATYTVKGAFELSASGGSIVVTPQFEEVKFLVRMRPSEQALGVIDTALGTREGLCGTALHKIDVKAKLVARVGKGFFVKLPRKLFRPIRLPAGIEQSLELQGIQLSLDVQPTGLAVTPLRLWYGASVETRKEGAAHPTPSP
jgi:hypothetical protein